MKNKIINSEKKMCKEEVSEKLYSLAEGLNKGKIKLETEKESTELKPNGEVEFKLQVEEENNEISLEVEIEWEKKENSQDDELDIKIG